APTEAPPPTEAPMPTEAPKPTEPPSATFEGLSLSAESCDYGGIIKSIEAVDEYTVKFTLCASDPAFLAKVAFSPFAIQPKEWLEQTGGGGQGSQLLEKPIGTGPYVVSEWKRGDELVFTANPDYWGEEKAKTPTLVFRWSSEAAQRLLELQAGTVDGIDNPGPDDFATIQADSNLALVPRQALNIFYVGMNNTYPPYDNEQVRQAIAMGIDRQRIVDNFYPVGSEVASHFTPCAIPNGCTGDAWYEFDPVKAKEMLAAAGFPDGFETELAYRDVVRGYLPQPGVVAQDIQAQLLENLNIKVNINVMESGAFLDASDSGMLTGLHLLGWGADYPDMTNFLDFHFGAGSSKQFGNKHEDLTAVLKQAAALSGTDARQPFYEQANNLIKQHVPMVPIAHGGSGTAYKATVEGAHSSPLSNETFSVMSVPGQDIFVWMQNAEPISLYCADETDGESLRGCEQVTESLYRYEVGGTDTLPNLAKVCEPNADLTEWVCTLEQGVKFHDGSMLDANDVVFSYLVQWDASSPLHTGNTGAFTYFSALWGAFLNAVE
ncbi:MAG: hypothetical protein JXB15_16345, partial [Anaerolineales bacterium]|nr:hypothetical protein [Anaerolineales bacterium]